MRAAVGCPALDDPRNGKVDVSQRSGGFTATYSCNQGFVLRGSRTRVCVSGVWQGEAPVCQGEHKYGKTIDVCIHAGMPVYESAILYRCMGVK